MDSCQCVCSVQIVASFLSAAWFPFSLRRTEIRIFLYVQREGATVHCIQTWISLPLDQNTVPLVVLTGRAFSPPPSQPASLLAEAAASSRGNLLQAPSLIITELLPCDSLGSFLSLPLHVCPLIQPTSRAAVSQHLSQMEDSSSLQVLLGSGDTTVTQRISSFFAHLSIVIFPLVPFILQLLICFIYLVSSHVHPIIKTLKETGAYTGPVSSPSSRSPFSSIHAHSNDSDKEPAAKNREIMRDNYFSCISS